MQEEPTDSQFSFSLCFHVFWVTVARVFFSGSLSDMTPSAASSSQRALIAASACRRDQAASGAWASGLCRCLRAVFVCFVVVFINGQKLNCLKHLSFSPSL